MDEWANFKHETKGRTLTVASSFRKSEIDENHLV